MVQKQAGEVQTAVAAATEQTGAQDGDDDAGEDEAQQTVSGGAADDERPDAGVRVAARRQYQEGVAPGRLRGI